MSVHRQIFCLKSLIFFMGLVDDLQSEIERRALPGGGWASGNGRSAGIETTCYALMALRDGQGRTRVSAVEALLKTQHRDGSWPAFENDDPEGCWTTALALIALRLAQVRAGRRADAVRWLLKTGGREGDWIWNWKFRTVDREVRFDPDKYGWPWFPGTVSWVIPTAISLVALKLAFPSFRTELVAKRIRLGTEMLLDRACPGGGWNAGNGIVFGAALTAHIDTTAIALLALSEDQRPVVHHGLRWLRQTCTVCSSAYSLAWSSLAFLLHKDHSADRCIARLREALLPSFSVLSTDTVCLAAIAINAAEEGKNPFQVI